MPRLTITNMSKGEFGPELYGRVDVPEYNAGVKAGLNFLIQRYGGMSFRPGFRFAGEVDNAAGIYKLTAFQYSIDQAYIQLHGDSQTRFLAEGGFVVEDDLAIEDVTYGATTIVHVPFHNYVVGERVWIDGTNVLELNNRFARVLSIPDADHVELDINSTGFPALMSSTGIVRTSNPAPPPTPEPPPPAPPPAPSPPATTDTGGDDLGGSTVGGPGTWNQRQIGGVLP